MGATTGIERTDRLFARGAIINGKKCEVWLPGEENLLQPLSWKDPRHIEVRWDLFHESVPDEWIDRIFAVMALCPQHTFQVLTKRAERMLKYLTTYTAQARRGYWMEEFGHLANALLGGEVEDEPAWFRKAFEAMRSFYYPDAPKVPQSLGDASLCCKWPLPNVWLGVSVEDQKTADARIPLLLQTPAAVRFISYEPALGPLGLLWDADWTGAGGKPSARSAEVEAGSCAVYAVWIDENMGNYIFNSR